MSMVMMKLTVEREWNGKPIEKAADKITVDIDVNGVDDSIDVSIEAPFYDNRIPPVERGSTPHLWDFEVVEIFFLNSKSNRYLELEFGPHGHYLILLLDGVRNCVKQGLELTLYDVEIDRAASKWKGRAKIPKEYLPPEFADKMNVYGIHESANNGDKRRVYKALYPVPGDEPDFHRIQHFGEISPVSSLQLKEASVWKAALGK